MSSRELTGKTYVHRCNGDRALAKIGARKLPLGNLREPKNADCIREYADSTPPSTAGNFCFSAFGVFAALSNIYCRGSRLSSLCTRILIERYVAGDTATDAQRYITTGVAPPPTTAHVNRCRDSVGAFVVPPVPLLEPLGEEAALACSLLMTVHVRFSMFAFDDCPCSLLSRFAHHDLDGYWALGKLYAEALENNAPEVVLQLRPFPADECSLLSSRIQAGQSMSLSRLLSSARVASSRVNDAKITVRFNAKAERVNPSETPTSIFISSFHLAFDRFCSRSCTLGSAASMV